VDLRVLVNDFLQRRAKEGMNQAYNISLMPAQNKPDLIWQSFVTGGVVQALSSIKYK